MEKLLQRKSYKKHNPDVIFTNHDVTDLPFKKAFDVILFKNTLHHISTEKQELLLHKLVDNSKQLILVDINDPVRKSLISKMWNKYYVWFLNDQGKSFLTMNTFSELAKKVANGKKVTFEQIKTVKGEYMYASITSDRSNFSNQQ